MRDKAFNIAKNPKYEGYQRGLASMVYKCFDKKSASLIHKSVQGVVLIIIITTIIIIVIIILLIIIIVIIMRFNKTYN